jgi:hypothetical protein
MQKWLDDRKKDHHSVTWLDAVGVGDRPVFAAVAALDDRNSGWLATLDLSGGYINNASHLAKWFSDSGLNGDNFEVVSLTGYAQAEKLMAVALFRPEPIGSHRKMGIVPISEAPIYLSSLGAQGYVARLIRPIPVGGDRLMCALYEISDLGNRKLHGFDLGEADLADQLETYRRDGYCPVSVVPYELRGERRFAVSYRKNAANSTWEFDRDLDADELRTRAAKSAPKGFTLASITTYPWDGEVRLAVVWVRNDQR